MANFKLKDLPLSAKLFISLFLCVMGLSYITLLLHIWVDTEMKVSMIMESYGAFEFSELVDNAHRYIFWFALTFAPVVALLFFTSFGEKLKRFFAVLPMLMIVSDIGSMWLTRYLSKTWFSWQLYLSGMSLAALFLIMFLLINYDIWFKKVK
ncbi:MAG: hypothetical protein CO035_03650 [Candidatus Omnitrophica bacterium CG_4_9_14_0_2_um_filter_42_8]|nr:MAG: hypothetical protein CO035_03650 [Candidatus Omnitrophica bacterium CG_4_9_14_0_2_um_filter_42_8]